MTGEAWRQYVQAYVELRRATGFSMQREESLLQDFVAHLERRGHDAPVAQVAVEWASASTESQHVGRLSIVRGFLTMVRAAEPDVDVPGAGLVRRCKRPTPRILAPDEIVALMDAARSLGPPNALRPHTVATVIGLLASCGLRGGEAIRLDIDQACRRARERCPSLDAKCVSPHVVRHTTAMHLLQAGVDMATIALWLGHERLETTHQYVEADLQLKEDALRKLEPLGQRTQRFKADSSLLAFLGSL